MNRILHKYIVMMLCLQHNIIKRRNAAIKKQVIVIEKLYISTFSTIYINFLQFKELHV